MKWTIKPHFCTYNTLPQEYLTLGHHTLTHTNEIILWIREGVELTEKLKQEIIKEYIANL